MLSTKRDSTSQRQKVIDAIQQAILDGELPPGEPLRQIPLSKEHGVSQSVIRESLHTLEQQGLVTSAGQSGFSVRSFGKHELVDAYQVREVLEGLAARLCCRKASRDDVDWLRGIANRIRDHSPTGTRAERSDLEYQFHQRFLSISGNETLQRVSVGYRFVGNLVVTERDPDELFKEHLAIIDAVADNQPAEAERLARQHVSISAASILNQGN